MVAAGEWTDAGVEESGEGRPPDSLECRRPLTEEAEEEEAEGMGEG